MKGRERRERGETETDIWTTWDKKENGTVKNERSSIYYSQHSADVSFTITSSTRRGGSPPTIRALRRSARLPRRRRHSPLLAHPRRRSVVPTRRHSVMYTRIHPSSWCALGRRAIPLRHPRHRCRACGRRLPLLSCSRLSSGVGTWGCGRSVRCVPACGG